MRRRLSRGWSHRRLVEDGERVHERRAERGRQVDTLRLSSREGGRQSVERQVVETDIPEERQAPPNLAQHFLGNGRFLIAEGQLVEEALDLVHRSADTWSMVRPPPARRVLAAQPRPPARHVRIRASAQEHADVHSTLALEPAEEAANALVGDSVSPDDEAPLLWRQVLPGCVERNVERARRALQRRELGPVVRPRPRLDRALADRSRRPARRDPGRAR